MLIELLLVRMFVEGVYINESGKKVVIFFENNFEVFIFFVYDFGFLFEFGFYDVFSIDDLDLFVIILWFVYVLIFIILFEMYNKVCVVDGMLLDKDGLIYVGKGEDEFVVWFN